MKSIFQNNIEVYQYIEGKIEFNMKMEYSATTQMHKNTLLMPFLIINGCFIELSSWERCME